jgi:hypothetical protein
VWTGITASPPNFSFLLLLLLLLLPLLLLLLICSYRQDRLPVTDEHVLKVPTTGDSCFLDHSAISPSSLVTSALSYSVTRFFNRLYSYLYGSFMFPPQALGSALENTSSFASPGGFASGSLPFEHSSSSESAAPWLVVEPAVALNYLRF